MTKIVNCVLLIGMIVGGVLAFRADSERRQLVAEYDRLAAETGYLPISDPDKIHFVRLKTEDPLHYRWRAFLPANQAYRWKGRDSSSYGSASKDPENFIAQVRFRFDDEEGIRLFHSHQSGSGVSSLLRGKAAKFVEERWDELEIRAVGLDKVDSFAIDQVVTLIEIRMPDAMFEQFEKEFPVHARRHRHLLYRREVGADEAFAKRDLRNGKATP